MLPTNTQPRLSILVVEDNADQRMLLGEILPELFACTVRAVADTTQALALACAAPPDIILLDFHLPPAGGLALVAQLRAEARLAGIPVILLSGSQRAADMSAIHAAHLAGFVEKPYDIETLELAIEAALTAQVV
ncbi:MAG TPA: response regulator [Chloroflexia bacterium]|nr:response regulator [Chloroflexia bacterium]